MAKMKFGDGIHLEIPLKEVIEPLKKVEVPIKETVEVIKEVSVDLSPIHSSISKLESKIKSNEHAINNLQHKEAVIKPEVNEITIYKNDSDEIETLVTEIKALDHQGQVNRKSNKENLLHIKATQHILNSQIAKQSILNIVLGMGLLISTLIKFI
jgi:chromosome segregation ATPase